MMIDDERVHVLIPRPLKWEKTDPVSPGDVVLFLFNETPGSKSDDWKVGIVQEIPKKNSLTIEYTIRGKRKSVNRCPRHVSVIVAAGELAMNSVEYFKKLTE